MPAYRLYLMNAHSGHIEGVETFHSGDDVEAILLVQGRERPVPAELWCGTRKVIRIDATPQTGAAAARTGPLLPKRPPAPDPSPRKTAAA